jgi:hypothetical protein
LNNWDQHVVVIIFHSKAFKSGSDLWEPVYNQVTLGNRLNCDAPDQWFEGSEISLIVLNRNRNREKAPLNRNRKLAIAKMYSKQIRWSRGCIQKSLRESTKHMKFTLKPSKARLLWYVFYLNEFRICSESRFQCTLASIEVFIHSSIHSFINPRGNVRTAVSLIHRGRFWDFDSWQTEWKCFLIFRFH